MTQPTDLFRIEGNGNGVALRITGKDESGALTGEFVIETPFVRGSVATTVSTEHLREWLDALDALDAGKNVAWPDSDDVPDLSVERDANQDRAAITITDLSQTTVTTVVPMTDEWFDDAYERLDRTWKTWDLTES